MMNGHNDQELNQSSDKLNDNNAEERRNGKEKEKGKENNTENEEDSCGIQKTQSPYEVRLDKTEQSKSPRHQSPSLPLSRNDETSSKNLVINIVRDENRVNRLNTAIVIDTTQPQSPSSSSLLTPRLHHSNTTSDLNIIPPSLTDEEKIELFDQLDLDKDKRIQKKDLETAMKAQAKRMEIAPPVDSIMGHFWSNLTDLDSLSTIEFDELVDKWHIPSQAVTLEAVDAKSIAYERTLPLGRRLLAHWSVEGPMSTFVMVFVSLQIATGLYYFVTMTTDPRLDLLGWGLPFAKGAAGVLYPSIAFVLLSSCRRLSTQLRKLQWTTKFINWDRSQNFHAILGMTILVFALIHALSHMSGTFRRAQGVQSDLLSNFPSPINYRNLIVSVPALTGICALVILIAIAFTSRESFKKKYFQTFQVSHLFIYAFIGLLLAHGSQSWIQSPVLGYWLIIPMICVFWDRTMRTINMFIPVNAKLTLVQDNTVVVSIVRPDGWEYKAGEYILLRIPEVSLYEWHPFTLVGSSSAPTVETYIRTSGDWTSQVIERCKKELSMTVTLDGPFGAPSQNLNKYDRTIIVGTGIGITPYAGFLPEVTDNQFVDLHWVVKERVSFGWFSSLLNEIKKDQVSVKTYVTGMKATSVLQHTITVLFERHRTLRHPTSFITGLKCETVYGRPNVGDIFHRASAKLPPNYTGKIGVFYCGPNYLGMELSDRCYLEREKTGAKWEFVGEVF